MSDKDANADAVEVSDGTEDAEMSDVEEISEYSL